MFHACEFYTEFCFNDTLASEAAIIDGATITIPCPDCHPLWDSLRMDTGLGWSCYDALLCNLSSRYQFSDVIVASQHQPFDQMTSNWTTFLLEALQDRLKWVSRMQDLESLAYWCYFQKWSSSMSRIIYNCNGIPRLALHRPSRLHQFISQASTCDLHTRTAGRQISAIYAMECTDEWPSGFSHPPVLRHCMTFGRLRFSHQTLIG